MWCGSFTFSFIRNSQTAFPCGRTKVAAQEEPLACRRPDQPRSHTCLEQFVLKRSRGWTIAQNRRERHRKAGQTGTQSRGDPDLRSPSGRVILRTASHRPVGASAHSAPSCAERRDGPRPREGAPTSSVMGRPLTVRLGHDPQRRRPPRPSSDSRTAAAEAPQPTRDTASGRSRSVSRAREFL